MSKNDASTDYYFRAQACHRAAQVLTAALVANSARQDCDIWPVVYVYRQAIEFHLKAMVLGGGGNFLTTKSDHISVAKTHSVSWLAQIVCQIVTTLGWEPEFKCEGVANLADFKVTIENVNSVDPGLHPLQCPVDPQSESSIRSFTEKLDAIIRLLDATGDALAAEWHGRVAGADFDDRGPGYGGGTTLLQ